MTTAQRRIPLWGFALSLCLASAHGAVRGAIRQEQEQDRRHLTEAGDALKDRYQSASKEEKAERMQRWGIMGSDLVDVHAHYANLTEPYDPTKDTPFFWMIPKSGTTTLGSYMTNCVDLVTGNEVGKFYESDTLEVVEHNHHKYINVDVTKRDGLDRAKQLGLAESALADVIITGFPIQVASIFNTHNKARMFTLMRHPFQRIVSEFYYVQIAEWEPISYKPWLKDWTIEQYVQSDYTVDNWMTRQLVGKSSTKLDITMEDVKHGIEILETKCLVGLTMYYKETVQRFQEYFGWKHDDHCFEELFAPGGKMNTNKHPTLEKGSRDYQALLDHDYYDLMLWQRAVELFEEQGKMFSTSAGQ